MINKEEIEYDMELSLRIQRICDNINDKVKRNGELSYYDEDVMFVINELLTTSAKSLTATEYVFKQREHLIHKEEIRHLERHIVALKEELQNQKEINKEEQKLNGELQEKLTYYENKED